ncbi:hypothetical protein EON81_20220 [bacterium]|nr:MAG: hypothetical protein EON81_20220 [bacterium]
MLSATLATAAPSLTASYRIFDQATANLDSRIFGHFMERPSWHGEIGPEAAVIPGTHKLQPKALALLKELRPSILRFPSGTDNDYVLWTDMIDRAPGRSGLGRPVTIGHMKGEVTNRFGYDEFLPMAREMKSQIILPVRFRDGLLGMEDLKESARKHAATLAAYVNGRKGQKLPADLEAYVDARMANGRKEPWNVEYFQIGNETWFFNEDLEKRYPGKSAERYVEALGAFIEAIHSVDPKIGIIADGVDVDKALLIREKLGDKVSFLVDHWYSPWEIKEFQRGGKPFPTEDLSEADIWKAWVAPWPVNESTGQARVDLNTVNDSGKHGYPVAITEWNWNGWWGPEAYPKAKLKMSLTARGLGAAGYLHAMMRRASNIQIACMSMTIGQNWDIDAIRVDPTGKQEASFLPIGNLMALYAQKHGDRVLRQEDLNVPTYEQPFSGGGIKSHAKVQTIDLVATATKKKLFLHVINRSFDEAADIDIDLTPFGKIRTDGTISSIEGPLERSIPALSKTTTRKVTVSSDHPRITLAPRTINVIELTRE